MSLAELLPSLHALPRSEKLQLLQIIAGDLASEERCSPSEQMFVPPLEDHCPYTPAELARFYQETGGVPLSEIWRKLGAT